jgi:pimeloyl-ACP methyl ester carboxylesterase
LALRHEGEPHDQDRSTSRWPAAIAAPTLLVWGDRDAPVPRADQDIALRAIASAKLSVYEGAGHARHWEQPERFAQDLTAFVDSLAGEVRAPQQP